MLSRLNSPMSRELKVLVVEDDFTSRLVLQKLLSKYGQVHIAVNGNEAVEAVRMATQEGVPYDLICMDIRLPEMDGTEAVRQIRDLERREEIHSTDAVRIFMTTIVRDIKVLNSSFKALCDAYLFKPIDGDQLEDQMQAFGLIEAVPQKS